MRREVREAHKLKRVMRLDKLGRYDVACKENKEVDNGLNKQLQRFKSTLSRGKDEKREIDK